MSLARQPATWRRDEGRRCSPRSTTGSAEGFDTVDLKDTKAPLQELTSLL